MSVQPLMVTPVRETGTGLALTGGARRREKPDRSGTKVERVPEQDSQCALRRPNHFVHPFMTWPLPLISSTTVGNAENTGITSAAQPFSPFWFTVEPQDTLAIRGNSALLNCSAHSDAATRVEWKKDGTFMSLVSDERRRILPDGSLFFTHVVHSKHNKPDEGTYQCVATIDNLGSISSRTARLSVAALQCDLVQFGNSK
eukprot:superscaffoldBa00000964_g8239